METIGEKIKSIRRSKGISQTNVADACNIKQSSYANIENGKTQNITIEIGKGIAGALDVSFNELFEIEDTNVTRQKDQAEIDSIKEILKEKNKQLEQKDLLIELLYKERDIYKESAIRSISGIYDEKIRKLEHELNNSQTEKDKEFLLEKIKRIKNQREFMFENFIYLGLFNQQDIDNYYNAIKEHYETLTKLNVYHKEQKRNNS